MDVSPKTTATSVLSILVVDDDALNQRMMRLLLKREGHQVECVSNGQEAFNAVKQGSYDMVLMDLQMPVMDGVEASRQIRAWEKGAKHTYIVALTASYLPERGAELFQAGIDNYIAKPFDVDHLRNILQFGIENREAKKIQTETEAGVVVDVTPRLVLDREVGLKRVGGDAEIYKEFLQEFIDELPDKLGVLWSCFRNKDMDGLNRAAHNLKGVSGNLGMLQLSEHAQRLEKQASEGYTDTIEGILEIMVKISDETKAQVVVSLSAAH